MDLNAVKLFVKAAEAGSISAAARASGIPLPTLSRQLRKLEEEIGLRLLERSSKGLVLTQAGARLAEDAAPALASLAQAQLRLHVESGVAGQLRISMPPHLGPLWSVFREFSQLHPAVNLNIFVTDRKVYLISDGIDIALRVGDSNSGSYVGRTLTRYRHQLVASPVLAKKYRLKEPQDLLSVPCACWRGPGPSQWRLGKEKIHLDPLLVTNDYQHLLQLAEAGDVVTELPPFMARPAIEKGTLVEILKKYPRPEFPMRALVVEKRAMPPLHREFLNFAAANIPQALFGG